MGAVRIVAGFVMRRRSGWRWALALVATPIGFVVAVATVLIVPIIVLILMATSASPLGVPGVSGAAADPFSRTLGDETLGPLFEGTAKAIGGSDAAGALAPLLAATCDDESQCGRSTAPGVHSGVNFAGCCRGFMQLSSPIWEKYQNAYKQVKKRFPELYDLARGRKPSVYDPLYAIPAAAAYFRDLGVRGKSVNQTVYDALLRYKGVPPYSEPYARRDFELAKQFERMSAGGGAVPAKAQGRPRTLKRLTWAANYIESLRIPYCWGGGHGAQPGPSRIVGNCWRPDRHGGRTHTAVGLDCSGAVRWLLVLSGYPDLGALTSSQFAGVYPRGRGERVTIWGNPAHVFIEIDGREWGTSTRNYASGPAWVPRSPDGFVASHPPGL